MDRPLPAGAAGAAPELMQLLFALLERGLIPDAAVRFGIRRLLAARLRAEDPGSEAARERRLAALVDELGASPIALHPEAANAQHYELPPELFQRILGPALKYSGCYWPAGVETLAAAEEAMLALTAERAEIADGQAVLDLGCGWGSLTLYLARRFPRARILAVSNSRSQGGYVLEQARRRGLDRVEVRTADVNDFDPGRRFDRVVSVEMFEHLRNYRLLLERIASWLEDDGKLFVHLFCHRRLAYPFADRGPSDWMARHFFTGGLMPSADLLPRFQGPLVLDGEWLLDGTHYQRTAEAWLANMDRRCDEVRALLGRVYGEHERELWWVRWRVFFMACAELFGFRGGEEWLVAHYRFRRPSPDAAP